VRSTRLPRFAWLASSLAVVVGLAAHPSIELEPALGLPASVLVGGVGLLLSYQTQQPARVRLFKGLFAEFNRRYDGSNDRLAPILESQQSMRASERRILVDYFNLCAEEHFFHAEGLIDERVRRAWSAGMRPRSEDDRIYGVWTAESRSEACCGFDPEASGLRAAVSRDR
jgi:hypothetical protein